MDELRVFKAKNGDEQAFQELFSHWNPKIYSYAWQFTKDREAAQEITQETWMAVAHNLRKLKKESLFPIWLYRIAQKKAADWLRDKYAHPTQAEEESYFDQMSDPVVEKNPQAIQIAGIRREISKMSANHRAILTLFYLENYDLDEISVILNIPAGTVKSRLHYAREKLKNSLEHKKEMKR